MSDAPLTPQQISTAETRVAKEAYLHRALDGFDQFIAALMGVQDDQTISSQTEIDAHKKVWFSAFAKALNAGLDLIQKSHGQLAQAGDIERAEEVIQTDTKALAVETKSTTVTETK